MVVIWRNLWRTRAGLTSMVQSFCQFQIQVRLLLGISFLTFLIPTKIRHPAELFLNWFKRWLSDDRSVEIFKKKKKQFLTEWENDAWGHVKVEREVSLGCLLALSTNQDQISGKASKNKVKFCFKYCKKLKEEKYSRPVSF